MFESRHVPNLVLLFNCLPSTVVRTKNPRTVPCIMEAHLLRVLANSFSSISTPPDRKYTLVFPTANAFSVSCSVRDGSSSVTRLLQLVTMDASKVSQSSIRTSLPSLVSMSIGNTFRTVFLPQLLISFSLVHHWPEPFQYVSMILFLRVRM